MRFCARVLGTMRAKHVIDNIWRCFVFWEYSGIYELQGALQAEPEPQMDNESAEPVRGSCLVS